MTATLTISGLEARVGKFHLGPIDLDIQPGMAMGFIGPNGAGKSTTIHAVLGLLSRGDSTVTVLGHPAPGAAGDWKRDVGFVLSEQGFYERLTVATNLDFFSSFYPSWDQDLCSNLARRLQLDPLKKVKTLSTGERMKLALVAALSHRPKLLIMDEPTSGLDPIVRAELVDILTDQVRAGDQALFLSTHILADAAALADELAFINGGKLVGRSSKDDLLATWRRISFRAAAAPTNLPGAVKWEHDGPMHVVTTQDVECALDALRASGAEILDTNRLSLEDISVHILQGAVRP